LATCEETLTAQDVVCSHHSGAAYGKGLSKRSLGRHARNGRQISSLDRMPERAG
jgi:hypothetical protein